jgi:hypothetical protein
MSLARGGPTPKSSTLARGSLLSTLEHSYCDHLSPVNPCPSTPEIHRQATFFGRGEYLLQSSRLIRRPGGRVSGPLLRQPIVDGLLPPPLWQPTNASAGVAPISCSPFATVATEATHAPVFTFSQPPPAECTTGDGTVGRTSSQYAYPLSSRRRPTTAATVDLRVDTLHPSH